MKGNKKKGTAALNIFKVSGTADRIILFFATWFGTGFLPFAPGTWGSLSALPFAAGAYSLGPVFYSISVIVVFVFSIPVSGAASKILKTHDASSIVIDEAAGIFVAMLFIPFSWTTAIAGFLMFRVFDILKPFPIGLLDRKIKGGAGIVLDDIAAGVYANVSLRIILIFIN